MSSILETFVINFKTNTDDVKKGTKEAKEATDKLKTSLTESEQITKKLGGSFAEIAGFLSKTFGGLVSIGAITAGLKAAGAYSEDLYQLGKNFQVNTQEVEGYEGAIDKASGAGRAFRDVLNTINTALGEASLGSTTAFETTLYSLGIRLRDNNGNLKESLDIFRELSEALHRFPKQEAIAIGLRAGIPREVSLFLQQGPDAIRRAQVEQLELLKTTEENKNLTHEFVQEWGNLKNVITGINEQLNTKMLPFLTTAVRGLEKLLQTKGAFEKAKAIGLGPILTPGYGIAPGVPGHLPKGLAHRVAEFLSKSASNNTTLKSFLSLRDPNIAYSKQAISETANLPISLQGKNLTNPVTNSRNVNITLGGITIETQATDNEGIASSIGTALANQLRKTINQWNDGVVA
jgi:hypothetical protein